MPIPCRLTIFGLMRLGKRQKLTPCAWQDWNTSSRMERKMARLKGAGSFYWPSPRKAYRRAHVLINQPNIQQIKIETISGREVARLYHAQ